MSTRNLPGEVKSGRRVRLTTLPLSVSRMSRYCGTLNISQPYGPPWPGTGIALPFTYIHSETPTDFSVLTVSSNHSPLQTSLCQLINSLSVQPYTNSYRYVLQPERMSTAQPMVKSSVSRAYVLRWSRHLHASRLTTRCPCGKRNRVETVTQVSQHKGDSQLCSTRHI
jgi:hypothetical protein